MIVPYSGCLYRLLVEVAIIAAIAIGVMIWQANRKRPVENVVPTNPKSAILQRIQLTGELVTSVAVVQVIVRNSEAREWLRLKVGTAEMLLVALGEVRAGVDLAALDETALAVEGDKITVMSRFSGNWTIADFSKRLQSVVAAGSIVRFLRHRRSINPMSCRRA